MGICFEGIGAHECWSFLKPISLEHRSRKVLEVKHVGQKAALARWKSFAGTQAEMESVWSKER